MRPRRGATAVSAAIVGIALTGCTATTVDTSAAASTAASDAADPPVTFDTTAGIADQLDQIQTLMLTLDQRIIDNDHQVEAIQAIDALWANVEPALADDGTDTAAITEAIRLARIGVERRRPADASKGYKILLDVRSQYEL